MDVTRLDLKEPASITLTGESLFKKVIEAMKEDPVIAEQMKKLDYPLARIGACSILLTDNMYTIAYLDSGSEGCWVNLVLCDSGEKIGIGTLKTLDEGLDAWRQMGILAGELSYLANEYIWQNT